MRKKLIIPLLLTSVAVLSGCSNDKTETIIEPDSNKNVSIESNSEKENEKENKKENIIKVGDVVKIEDKFEINLKSIKFSEKVLPDDTSGFYTYFEAEEGQIYIEIDTDIKNLQKTDVMVDEIGSLEVDYNNGYKYNAFLKPESSKTGFSYANITAISPLKTLGVRWLVDVPLEVKDSKEPIVLTFTIGDETFKLNYR